MNAVARPSAARSTRPAAATAHDIARLAVRSLHAEVTLYPKPGLVSLRDNGAHRDMSAVTFGRSLFALRHYFAAVAQAGIDAAPMATLRALGIDAEARMLRATAGVNTHRGAIFALGLLCAAAGRAAADARAPSDAALRDIVATHWRRDLIAVRAPLAAAPSHGQLAAARHGVAGARGEAIRGFPAVFEVALPALREALARGAGEDRACIHAFFALLASVADTNVLHRGGAAALVHLQRAAAAFLARGGVFAHDWLPRAEALHRHCSHARISPGGCADLFAAAWFVHHLQSR